MTKKNQPLIRFKGYEEAWEQRKLGDLMKVTSVKRIHQSDWTDRGIRFLRARDIVSTFKGEEPSEYLYISKEKYEEYSLISGKVDNGDLLVTGVGSIGIPLLIDNKKPVYFKDGNIIWFQNKRQIDGDFFYFSFIGNNIQNFIKSVAGIGTVGTYTIDSGKKTPISLPSMNEQQKIGKFFKQLDETITLQERELELLKEQKKGFLQKLFPKDRQILPDIRFEHFEGIWEQRMLGEVFEQTVTYVNPENEKLELWSVTVEKGLTPKTERYNRDALVKKKDKFKVVHPGEIVYNPMNLTIGSVGFNTSERSVAVSGYYVTMRMSSNFNNNYFNTWLPSKRAIDIYKTYSTGSLIEKQRVQFPTLSSIKTSIPKIEEQTKIGNFFKQLDEAITLQENKLENLKQIKKAFLQKMFI